MPRTRPWRHDRKLHELSLRGSPKPIAPGSPRLTPVPRTFNPAPLGVSLTLASETATNLFGASMELQGVVATFASADVQAIAARGDVEAILITTAGEFKCNLDDTRIKRGYDPLDD